MHFGKFITGICERTGSVPAGLLCNGMAGILMKLGETGSLKDAMLAVGVGNGATPASLLVIAALGGVGLINACKNRKSAQTAASKIEAIANTAATTQDAVAKIAAAIQESGVTLAPQDLLDISQAMDACAKSNLEALPDAIIAKLAELGETIQREDPMAFAAIEASAAALTAQVAGVEARLTAILAGIAKDTVLIPAIGEATSAAQDAHAPHLTLPNKPTDRTRNQLDYKSERLTLVGREDELKELNAWLDKPDAFSWDLWVGPAGSGKNRLALHVCRQRSKAASSPEVWHAGFCDLDVTDLNDWRQWTPRQHTLIVIDTVAVRAEYVGRIVDILTQRAVPTSNAPLPQGVRPWPRGIKVRCLLLERSNWAKRLAPHGEADAAAGKNSAATKGSKDTVPREPSWLMTLRMSMQKNGAAVQETYHRVNINDGGRTIAGVSVEAARAIIAEDSRLAGEMPSPHALDNRLAVAKRVDPQLRPLFVAMVAKAHRETSGEFSFDDLISYVQEKEWKEALDRLDKYRSGPGAPHEAWEKLVCLATMCGGLDGATLHRALAQREVQPMPTTSDWVAGERYELLVADAGRTHASPIEPDILGEAFVLQWLTRNSLEAASMITLAWTLGMADFCMRCCQSFPKQAEDSGLLEPRSGAVARVLAQCHEILASRESREFEFAEYMLREIARSQPGQISHGTEQEAPVTRVSKSPRGLRLLSARQQPALVRAVGAELIEMPDLAVADHLRCVEELHDLVSQPTASHEVWNRVAYRIADWLVESRDDKSELPGEARLISIFFDCVDHAGWSSVKGVGPLHELVKRIVPDHDDDYIDFDKFKHAFHIVARLVDRFPVAPPVIGGLAHVLAYGLANFEFSPEGASVWLEKLNELRVTNGDNSEVAKAWDAYVRSQSAAGDSTGSDAE